MATKKIEELLKEKTIEQIVNEKVVEASSSVSVEEAIQAMKEKRSGYVVLTENEKVVGIFTEVDLVQKLLARGLDPKKPVRDFMTPDPEVLTPKSSCGEAIDLMAEHSIYHLPLVDESKKLVGMLSVRTLIRFLSEYYPTEIFNLPPDPNQVSLTPEGG